MTESFEGFAQKTENGIEFWLSPDIQHLLDYTEWRNFINIVSKDKTACEVSDNPIKDHFVDITKWLNLALPASEKLAISC